MNELIELAEILVLCYIGFFLLYLTGLSVLALFARNRTPAPAHHLRKFAVVVPAHNEEASLGKTLQSLFEFDYPRDKYHVFVVADNCTDRTADIALELGAEVLVRNNPERRGKGYALRWCFDQLSSAQQNYEAIVVIDADSEASGNFLAVMNSCLEQGAEAIQCSDMVKPQPGAWSSEMTRVGFTLYNHVRPLARSLLGGSAGLRGNGMAFSIRVVREFPWDAYSLNEDLEYGLQLLIKGVTITFAVEAKVFATMPVSAMNAESQRARWEGGRFPIIRKYMLPLLKMGFVRRQVRFLDALVDLITPPLVNLLALATLVLCVNILLLAFGVSWALTGALISIFFVGLGFVHMIVGLWAAGADSGQFKALLYLPRYALWKVFLYTKILRRWPAGEWVRTTRET